MRFAPVPEKAKLPGGNNTDEVEVAESVKALKATASAQPGDDPKIAALKADAQKAIEAGELAKADNA